MPFNTKRRGEKSSVNLIDDTSSTFTQWSIQLHTMLPLVPHFRDAEPLLATYCLALIFVQLLK